MNKKPYAAFTSYENHLNHTNLQNFDQTTAKSSNIETKKAQERNDQNKSTFENKVRGLRPENPSENETITNQNSLGKTESNNDLHKMCHDKMLEFERKIIVLQRELKSKNERFAALESENKRLKTQVQVIKAKQATSTYSNQHNPLKTDCKNYLVGTNSTAKKAFQSNNKKDAYEEFKSNSRPPEGISDDEWKSIQLAKKLEFEERKMLQKNGNSRKTQKNRPSHPSDDINPDEMTYEELLALEAAIGEVSRGLTKEDIKMIPKYEYKSCNQQNPEDMMCSVCFCQYENEDKLRKLQCMHEFHSKCIKKWLLEQKTCPICKIDAL